MALDASVRHLRDYIALPSVNPMGRSDLPAEIAGERRYAEHLQAQLRGMGLDASLVGDPERPSVVAEARVAGASDTVMVASHLDTVPVDGMEIPPFDPVIADGRVYGRGSCDTKGGMASLVAALEPVLENGTLRRNLILVGESDEELGSEGAREIVTEFSDRPPDWAIATEPTSMRIVTHHKGIAIVRLRAQGVACHSSAPDSGRSAIVALARAIEALEVLRGELVARPDPMLGPGTLSVGLIGGGQAPNIVPDNAWLVSDRRLIPGDDAASVRQEIEDVFAREGVEDIEIETCSVEKAALGTDRDHPIVATCLKHLAAEGLAAECASVAFGTDAGLFAEQGWPSIVIGPGSIEQAHTSREFVPVEEVESAARWFRRLLEDRP